MPRTAPALTWHPTGRRASRTLPLLQTETDTLTHDPAGTVRAHVRFVAPARRNHGEERELLARRRAVYADARARHPERWTGECRDWTAIDVVVLNAIPERDEKEAAAA